MKDVQILVLWLIRKSFITKDKELVEYSRLFAIADGEYQEFALDRNLDLLYPDPNKQDDVSQYPFSAKADFTVANGKLKITKLSRN